MNTQAPIQNIASSRERGPALTRFLSGAALCLTFLVSPCLSLAQEAKKEDKPEVDLAQQARDDFDKLKGSRSLQWDWNAICRFINLEGDDVLDKLITAYKKPPSTPQRELRYLLATGIRLRYTHEDARRKVKLDEVDVARLLDFVTQDCQGKEHTWGAYNAFRALGTDKKQFPKMKDQATEGSTPLFRAATIEALGHLDDEARLDFLGSLLEGALNTKKKEDRALLVESIAWAMANICAAIRHEPDTREAARRGDLWPDPMKKPRRRPKSIRELYKERTSRNEDDVRRALDRLAPLIDVLDQKKKLLSRTSFQIQLALQHALGTTGLFPEAESWRHVLRKKTEPPKPEKSNGAGRTVVRFMGIEGRGERIVFILDASDSMLKPLSEAEKAALRALIEEDKASVTSAEDGKKKQGRTVVRGGRGKRRTPYDSDWDKIVTRFDAARAHLKHTLSKMEKGISFAVVIFGNKAELLKRTPRFIPATKTGRLAVVKELDSIVPGPKGTNFPHGRLRGQTNIHAAFDLAFRVTTRGVKKDPDINVNPDYLSTGAETFFFLSDGQPTIDDFAGTGPTVEVGGFWQDALPPMEGEYIDPETGAKKKYKTPGSPRRYIPKRKTRRHYHNGPYIENNALIDDLRRRNLFLRAVIHVVGIGEAGQILPERIAKLGHGKWIRIAPEIEALRGLPPVTKPPKY